MEQNKNIDKINEVLKQTKVNQADRIYSLSFLCNEITDSEKIFNDTLLYLISSFYNDIRFVDYSVLKNNNIYIKKGETSVLIGNRKLYNFNQIHHFNKLDDKYKFVSNINDIKKPVDNTNEVIEFLNKINNNKDYQDLFDNLIKNNIDKNTIDIKKEDLTTINNFLYLMLLNQFGLNSNKDITLQNFDYYIHQPIIIKIFDLIQNDINQLIKNQNLNIVLPNPSIKQKDISDLIKEAITTNYISKKDLAQKYNQNNIVNQQKDLIEDNQEKTETKNTLTNLFNI